MKNIIVTGLIAGFVLFAWSSVSWMFLPWHMNTFAKFKDEAAVKEVLMTNVNKEESKIYIAPSECDGKDASPENPHIFMAYTAKHIPMPMHFVIGFLTQAISAMLVALLLSKTALMKYSSRVLFVVAIGLLIGLNSYIVTWNWLGFAPDYTSVGFIDELISWLLAGLVIGRMVKST